MRILFLLLPVVLFTTTGEAQQVFETFLEPDRIVDIASIKRERIDALHVREGDHVMQGQLLVTFANSVTTARLRLAEEAAGFQGDIDAATALVEQRKSRVAVLQRLSRSGNARPQELESALTNLAMAEAQLLKASEEKHARISEVAIIQAELKEKQILSPINGIVLTINHDEAELVGGADQVPIMTLVQLEPLKAVFHVPMHIAAGLREGEALSLSIGGERVKATVDFVSPVIEAQSDTVIVRFRLPNPSGTFISGSRITFTPNHP